MPASAKTAASTKPKQPDALFEVETTEPAAHAATGLGARLVASDLYREQRELNKRIRIDDAEVTALIDALDAAGGVLSVPRIREVVPTQAKRNLVGWLAGVRTVLNVDSYLVLSTPDRQEMVMLDTPLLREQFGIGDS